MDAYALAARLDYGFLRWAARLPRPFALSCCAMRALLRFCFNVEWRSYALKRRYVRGASAKAYAQLQAKPPATPGRNLGGLVGGILGRILGGIVVLFYEGVLLRLQRYLWVLARFWVESVEEFDVIRLAAQGLKAGTCSIKGLEDLENTCNSQGLVLLTAHLESLYLPLCHLAAQGRSIYLAASQIVEDPQVPAPIRAHFQFKKAALETHLGKGHVVYVEQGMARLVRALQAGAVVVIACDSPAPEASRGFRVGFLGQVMAMAQGPRWLAMQGQAHIALMSVKRLGFWHYQLDIHGPYPPAKAHLASDAMGKKDQDEAVDAGLQAAYQALDGVIRQAPWRWWAADLVLRDDPPPSVG